MKQLVLATQNKNKLKEVKAILEPIGYTILTLSDVSLGDIDVVEDKDSFEGNAIKKASEISQKCSLPVLADDSGLEVDALNGAPGVYSARYSGEDANYAKNNEKLLREMQGVADEKRSARFVCVMAYIDKDKGEEYVVRGEVEGNILHELTGEDGFGYDPLFYQPDIGMSFAQASPALKNKYSHRGRALQKMRSILEEKK